MKELNADELYQISGSGEYCSVPGVLALGGAVKGGESAGGSLARLAGWYDVIPQATRAGGSFALVAGGSFLIGSCIYENSSTVRETAIGMMESIDQRYFGGRIGQPDQSGNNYDGTDY